MGISISKKKVRKKARGKGKGSKFERDLSRDLSLWWSRGKRDDIFWRTSQSGGRSKTRMKTGKSTFGQYGDIQATDPYGAPLLRLLTIEAKKGYNKESCGQAIDRPHKKISGWEEFQKQAEQDATNAGTPWWMVIHRRDSRSTIIVIRTALAMKFHTLWRRATPQAVIRLQDGQVFVTTFDEFKTHVDPREVRDLVNGKVRIYVRVP